MRRTILKWLHWVGFGFLLYFLIVEPDDAERRASSAAKTDALATHAGVGVLLAILVAIWWLTYWRNGLASRPGPKLPAKAKLVHQWGHRALYWALPIMMLTGGLTGLVAPFPVLGFGVIPLNFGDGVITLYDIAEEVHEIAFDALTILAVVHISFHLWRHYLLKDNALRIMVPKVLHRWL